MSKSSHPLVDLLRLLLLIVLLPLIILLAGPLLVAAAILGGVSVFGVVKLAPGKHLRWGRLWAFIIGLLLWMIVWGSAAWLWLNYAPTFTLSAVMPATPTIRAHSSPSAEPALNLLKGQAFQPAPSPTVGPTATSIPTPEPSATIVIATDMPTSSPAAAPLPSAAPSNTPTASASNNTPTASPTSTTVVTAPQVSPVASTPTPLPTSAALSPDEKTRAFDAVAQANDLLLRAIEAPTDENIAALESAWQGKALSRAGRFARLINQKYQPPVQAHYSIIGLPVITSTTSDELSVQSREFWVFEAEGKKQEALNEYEYTLQRYGDGWAITFYQFKNIPLPTNPNAITGTEVITFGSLGISVGNKCSTLNVRFFKPKSQHIVWGFLLGTKNHGNSQRASPFKG